MFVLLIMQIMAQSDDGDVIDCVDMYHQPALIKRAPLEKSTEILQVSILQILRCLLSFLPMLILTCQSLLLPRIDPLINLLLICAMLTYVLIGDVHLARRSRKRA